MSFVIEWMQRRNPSKPYNPPRFLGGSLTGSWETQSLRRAWTFRTVANAQDRRANLTRPDRIASRVVPVTVTVEPEADK